MDTEQQIRLNFLDEADEYFEYMESHFLGLASGVVDPYKIDIVLRSAHSIKGGAAMMGFRILSQVAHRLEDFLKILRVRYAAREINSEVETLLLQSVDCLRVIGELNRQGVAVADSEAYNQAQLIFEQLQEHLGELAPTDEDALMAQNEGVDPALLIFEEGVETVLDHLEVQVQQLDGGELSQELDTIAQELIAFGKMANLASFVELSQSIHQQTITVPASEISTLADAALKAWRRSHALVLRGSIEKLPSSLTDYHGVSRISDSAPLPRLEVKENEGLELNELESAVNCEPSEAELGLYDDSSLELNELKSAFDFDTSQVEDQSLIEANAPEFNELESAFDFEPSQVEDQSLIEADVPEFNELASAFDFEPSVTNPTIIQPETSDLGSSLPSQETPTVGKMSKIPTAQLKQFNNLFEQLILDRNSINLRLKQLQNVVFLLVQRIEQMESSNTRLKEWYDQASLAGLLVKSRLNPASKIPQEQSLQKTFTNFNQNGKSTRKALSESFDPLEMDRYSDIHLICQEQIETIVQLQEVATDLELEVQEINQTVRNLNYTTKFMQGNVTRTQMLPFAEIVQRFPRIIRDLNLKFNKQVKLNIIGENTFLDRTFIKPLRDSLIHLLRNSFDHGIEDPETRIAQGKDPSGTITIQASNQGTYSLIHFIDDGCGISLGQICDRLSQMGLPASEVRQIPDPELLNFIFEPGFSTAKQVTELSGRGMGMDIVRTNIQEIHGDVQISTEPGKGTTFTLKIPLTLSILRVAIIEQSGIVFAIPADSIRELVPSFESAIINPSDQTKYLNWHNTEIPLVEIEKTLIYHRSHKNIHLTGNPIINKTMALVVGNEKLVAALKISRFWQEQESTIRPIESPIPLPTGVISSMIFGDGKVIPLIDPILVIDEYLKDASENDQFNQNFTEDSNIPTTQTILVVDDSINVRRYLCLTLEKAGYQVEQARDGQEALNKLLSGIVVQAVICDIEMPRLDGYDFLEEIKGQPELEHLPVMMLTSRSNEKHRKLAFNLGASAYFPKPYNERELLAKLAQLLS